MEIITDSTLDRNLLGLNQEAMSHLEKARKWTLFLSIMGLIFIALMVLTPFFAMRHFALPEMPAFGTPMFTLIPLLIFAVIYFFPFWYLLQFSRLSKSALETRDENTLARALHFLRLHYQYMGVLVIIGAVIYLLAIFGMMVGVSMMNAF
ncbi:MAG: hypothetical protein V2I46_11455 [Bacteroides sp.]|jgi:protein-S-isoprenylcysteine O-methyltransferase Ste14|nr:hypothetical protein [Bacteroides sp.]